MKSLTVILLGICGLALQGIASAQIYESTDAEGVTEFSDTPTEGAEVVDLQQTNVADEPADIPAAPQAAAPEPAQAAASAGEAAEGVVPGEMDDQPYDVYDNVNNDDNAREQRRLTQDRIDNALPGNPGPGIGEPGVGVEPRPIEHPGGVRR